MNRKQLKKNLHMLQDVRGNINPRASFVHEMRSRLLTEVAKEHTSAKTSRFSMQHVWELMSIFVPNKAVYAVVRPFVVVFMVFGLATGSWITGAFASINSVPGDTLYPVKLGIEKTTVAVVGVTQGDTAEAQLRTEYAGRRLEEVKNIVHSDGEDKNVDKAVQRFKNEIAKVQESLDELKTTDPTEAVALAKVVDAESDAFAETLQDTENKLAGRSDVSDEVKQSVAEAAEAASATDTKTVEVYIEALTQGAEGLNKEDVVEAIDKKIRRIGDAAMASKEGAEDVVDMIEEMPALGTMVAEVTKVSSGAEEVVRKTEAVQEALEEAKELLEDDALAAAQKLQDSLELTREVREEAEVFEQEATKVNEGILNTMEVETVEVVEDVPVKDAESTVVEEDEEEVFDPTQMQVGDTKKVEQE